MKGFDSKKTLVKIGPWQASLPNDVIGMRRYLEGHGVAVTFEKCPPEKKNEYIPKLVYVVARHDGKKYVAPAWRMKNSDPLSKRVWWVLIAIYRKLICKG